MEFIFGEIEIEIDFETLNVSSSVFMERSEHKNVSRTNCLLYLKINFQALLDTIFRTSKSLEV
ncbi:MAG: hypothetical protein AAF617_07310, partial [Bacteroidota bacterium]